MAHLTDCSTSPNDLLDKLRIWLLARGWMVDSYIADGAGYRLHLHKGTTYLNFRSFNNETPTPWKGAGSGYGIAFNMGTGYSAASNWYSQPGIPLLSGTEPAGTGILLGPGPYQSHQFFDDGQGNFLILVERTPGIWRKLAWGDSLDKSGAGSWVGGAYFSGFTSFGYWSGSNVDPGTTVFADYAPMSNCISYNSGLPNSFVRADVDTFTNQWITLAAADIPSNPNTGKLGCNSMACDDWASAWTQPVQYDAQFKARLFSAQDCRPVLMPMMIFVKRDSGGMSFLGTVPSMAISAASSHGLSIAQDLTIGSETWRQFPGFLVKVVP